MPKALLINPAFRTVSPVTFSSAADMRKLIDCNTFTIAAHHQRYTLYVDDNGLWRAQHAHFFRWLPRRDDQPLADNGLLVGPETSEIEPYCSDLNMTPEKALAQIEWLDRSTAIAALKKMGIVR